MFYAVNSRTFQTLTSRERGISLPVPCGLFDLLHSPHFLSQIWYTIYLLCRGIFCISSWYDDSKCEPFFRATFPISSADKAFWDWHPVRAQIKLPFILPRNTVVYISFISVGYQRRQDTEYSVTMYVIHIPWAHAIPNILFYIPHPQALIHTWTDYCL